MLKARAYAKDGTPLMLLGLSKENVDRLTAGKPIAFNAASLGLPPCHVLITYGETEQDILNELAVHGVAPTRPAAAGET
jgi:hypothetical protein